MVGIANEGLRLYFVVARNSQKFTDISRDDRVSLAIGHDVIDPSSIRALAIKARAKIVEDAKERNQAVELLFAKRPALKRLEEPNDLQSAVMSAIPEQIRLLDYSIGYGHSVLYKLDANGRMIEAVEQLHSWGYGSKFKDVN
jgi:nitroimidazol reductase NimA-like FMN-containing flavoprotein (pyridoxamine 5'-phosphate oxidase superfamily)